MDGLYAHRCAEEVEALAGSLELPVPARDAGRMVLLTYYPGIPIPDLPSRVAACLAASPVSPASWPALASHGWPVGWSSRTAWYRGATVWMGYGVHPDQSTTTPIVTSIARFRAV